MRAGSEQFILKDFEFYDSMVTPALGVTTVFVYEILRRHIWRALDRGSKRSKDAFRAGKLCASIGRQKVALMTGLSVRQIQKDLNRLRAVGWVRSKNGRWTGETLLYELGYREKHGTEVFYADGSIRELHLHLAEVAASREKTVNEVSCEERLEFALKWFEGGGAGVGGDEKDPEVVHDVHYGSAQDALPPSVGSAQGALIIENPPGEEIEKSEECPGGCAPDRQTGPGPKHWDQPAGQERSKRSRKKKEEEQMASSLLLTEESGSGHDEDEERDRLADAAAVVERAKAKTNDQVVEDSKRRLERQRTEKLAKKTMDESRVKNLDGRQYPPDVVKGARRAWDVYKAEVEAWDDGFVVPQWSAKGSTKTRGQMLELVSMYGGEATEQALRYVVRNWDTIGSRMFKNSPGGVPNLGRLFALHEQLFREATVWGRHREVLEEWEEWFKENPMKPAPSDLKERYEGAQQMLSSLGLGC